jgi:hypothetical protein
MQTEQIRQKIFFFSDLDSILLNVLVKSAVSCN